MPVIEAKSTGENPLAKKVYKFKSLRPCDLNGCTRKEIREYFENTYDLDELVFAGLKEEKSFYLCPDRLRLPLIFYVAHPATLYINKLLLTGLITKRVNRHYESLFETGVDEMSWDDTENYRMGGSYKWPSLADVLEYRRQVKEVVIDVIENAPLEFPITPQSPWWSLFMGMEHERIHLETSSVLIRQLPIDHVQKPTNWIYAPPKISDAAVRNEMITVPEGTVRFGKPVDFPSYGWDNEYGQVEMNAPEFEASKYLVTNREFFEFVNAGGYKNKQYWTDEGWKWVTYCGANHPTFWVCQEGCKSRCGAALSSYSHCLPRVVENGHANGSMNGETNTTKYRYRTVYDVIDMPWDWPVDINYHEAKAFCKWKGPDYRLPTEAEHHRMRGDPDPSTDILCDPVFRKDTNINLQFKYGSSNPVNMFPATPLGFHDIYGNVWEWVEDHFNGLPGFEAVYLYNDFSTPCFDGRHTLMMVVSGLCL